MWLRHTSANERRAMLAAYAGYGLDGFFVLGIFSGIGACFAELFPREVRGSGQGFCYSTGRAIGAACPALIGAWSAHVSLGQSIGAMTVACYALSANA